MKTEYLEMPENLLTELGANVALTKEMRYAHGCSDSGGRHLHFCTMYGGKRYKTTEAQIETARIAYEQNKAAAIAAVGDKLVFVGMGMNYPARFEGDVCNHRIRTEIINPEGRRFFIEVGTGRGENMRIDHVVNRDQEDEYNEQAQKYRAEIEANGGFCRIGSGHPLFENYKKYQSQPYYWYKREQWESLNTKYTVENILKLVNTLFDCKFTEMEIDYYHLTTDDYSSISPK
jgi:hypothetical protein